MALNFSNPDSFMLWYQQQLQRLVPTVKAPKVGDWQKVVEGTRPVLEQEERAARQRAASQFAKLGMPVSSAYMERLGRIGGETAAKMADITNKYAFEAAQKQADLEMQAALANQQAMMQAIGGLGGLLQQLFGGGAAGGGKGSDVQAVQERCRAAGFTGGAFQKCVANALGLQAGNPEVEAAKEKCAAAGYWGQYLEECIRKTLGLQSGEGEWALPHGPERVDASGGGRPQGNPVETLSQRAGGCENADEAASRTCQNAGYQPATAAYRTCYEKWLQYYLEQNRAKGC